ncbi:MAG: hypothetical protein GX752_02305, partial [Clostridium sp.]|nr:hypothetical protein [Clostridium sp.]
CEYVKELGSNDGEVESIHWVKIDEIIKLIAKNKIKDGISIAAFMKYFIYKRIIE